MNSRSVSKRIVWGWERGESAKLAICIPPISLHSPFHASGAGNVSAVLSYRRDGKQVVSGSCLSSEHVFVSETNV
jgi:hypothetical protein